MEVSQVNEVFGLNEDAWNKWVAYKKSMKKPYKTALGIAKAQKTLAACGEWQMETVQNCMEREWQGIFPLPKQAVQELEKRRSNSEHEQRQFEAMKIRTDKVRFRAPRNGESSRDYRIDLESAERRFEDAQYRARVATSPKSLRELLMVKS
jgi:hypothetical protein